MANSQGDRSYLAPALTWQPDERTSLTVLAHWQDDRTSPAVFLTRAGQEYPASEGALPGSFTDARPEWDRYHARQASIATLFSHQSDDSWTVRQNQRYARQDTDYRELFVVGMASDSEMDFYAFTVDEVAEAFMADNPLQHQATIGGVDKTLLLGVDYTLQRADGRHGE